jgi:hypothetical protein
MGGGGGVLGGISGTWSWRMVYGGRSWRMVEDGVWWEGGTLWDNEHCILSLCVGIIEDVRDECTRYGRVVGLAIPRPLGDLNVPGVGKVSVWCPRMGVWVQSNRLQGFIQS